MYSANKQTNKQTNKGLGTLTFTDSESIRDILSLDRGWIQSVTVQSVTAQSVTVQSVTPSPISPSPFSPSPFLHNEM